MYELLMMVKQGETFSPEEMVAVVEGVATSGRGEAHTDGTSILLEFGTARIRIDYNDAPHVANESDEFAESFQIACAGSTARFEMSGSDPDMDLMNDQLLICERLEETGKFVIFDPAESLLFVP